MEIEEKFLIGVIRNCGNILTRSVMETDSLDFGDLADKMTEPLIIGAMTILKQKFPDSYNKQIENVNYLLQPNKKYERISS